MIDEISGPERGAIFENRRAIFDAGWHNQTDAGIAGKQETGATSVVLSGGYPDDEDDGEVVIYTGHGGRGGRNSKAQVANQTFDARGNAALVTSCLRGTPIRVFRGGDHEEFRPATGYRYDGLYQVDSYWYQTGQDGFQMCRFKLVALEGAPLGFTPPEKRPTKRIATTIQRLVRDTAKSREVKEMHDHRCQACGIRLDCLGGPYAEGAHIRPLGRPHDGPDETTNLLCLCPNHHVLFDNGGFSIADDFSLIGLPGKLRTAPRHQIGAEHLRYHREQWRSA